MNQPNTPNEEEDDEGALGVILRTPLEPGRRKVSVQQFQHNFLTTMGGRPNVDVPGYVPPDLGEYAHLVWEPSNGGDNNPKLYLGSAEAALEGMTPFSVLQHANIGGIVNCTKDIRCRHRNKGVKYAQVAINDVPGADLITYLPGATAFVHTCLTEWSQSVLVHCMAGISRSTSVVLAYLMEYQGMTLEQAYTHVKARRPVIDPNDGFWAQLVAYEKRCRSRRQMEQSKETTNQLTQNERHEEEETSINGGTTTLSNRDAAKLDRDWAKQSSATFATCRELLLPGDTLEQACFGKLYDLLSHSTNTNQEVDAILNWVLDWIWGRGVLSVEVDWLVEVCRVLNDNTESNAAQCVERILTDPSSKFLSDWTGEVYLGQLKRVFEALSLGPPVETTEDKDEDSF